MYNMVTSWSRQLCCFYLLRLIKFFVLHWRLSQPWKHFFFLSPEMGYRSSWDLRKNTAEFITGKISTYIKPRETFHDKTYDTQSEEFTGILTFIKLKIKQNLNRQVFQVNEFTINLSYFDLINLFAVNNLGS